MIARRDGAAVLRSKEIGIETRSDGAGSEDGGQPTQTPAAAAAAAVIVDWSSALATPSGGLETNYQRTAGLRVAS